MPEDKKPPAEKSERPQNKHLRPRAPWKKGESGNPAGKPKGTRNRSTLLNHYLDLVVKLKDKSVPDPIDPKKKSLIWEELMIVRLLEQGNKGKIDAIKEIFDMKYGKQTNKVEMGGLSNANPIPIQFVDDI